MSGLSTITFSGLLLTGTEGLVVTGNARVLLTDQSEVTGNFGGGLQVDGNASVTIDGGTSVAKNTKIGRGAGLYVSGNAVVLVSNATVSGNIARSLYGTTARSRGGGIYAGGRSAVTISHQAGIQDNKAAYGGGVAAVDQANVTIENNSKVSSNIAAGGVGGGIYAAGNATVTVTGLGLVSSNVAILDLSLIEAEKVPPPAPVPAPVPTDSEYSISDLLPLPASALPEGTPEWPFPIPVPDSRSVSVPTGTDSGRKTTSIVLGGGGVAAAGISSIHFVNGSTLYNNTAVALPGGGGSARDAAQITISAGSAVHNNLAEQHHGGGIYLKDRAMLSCQGAEFLNNTAVRGVGGAVAAFHNATVAIAGSSVRNNTAFVDLGSNSVLQGEGGALYAWDSAVVNVTNSTIFVANAALRGSDAQFGPFVAFHQDASCNATNVLWLKSECHVGEVKRFEWCEGCPRGTFRFDANGTICLQCHLKANCTGKDVMYPLPGYWHSSAYSTQIHECPSRVACQYNASTGEACSLGYQGHMCGSCKKGWARLGAFNCVKCLEPAALVWAVFVLGGLLLVGLVCYTVHATWKDNESTDSTLRPSDALKVFIRHVQYLIIAVGNLRWNWGQALSSVWAAVGLLFSAATPELVALDCILPEHVMGAHRAIIGQLLYLLAPLMIFITVMVLFLLWCAIKNCRSNDGSKHSFKAVFQLLPVAAMVVLFFFHPWLVRIGLSMFACYDVDVANAPYDPYPEHALATAEHGYWVLDMQQACYVGWHEKWAKGLGIPCTVVFAGVVPLAILLGLSWKRSKLYEPHFHQYFGFLYRNFAKSKYFWEAVVALQNVLLVTIAVFSSTVGVYYATLLLNAAFGVLIIIQLLFKPYAMKRLHSLQLMSFCCLFATTYAGLSFLSVDRRAPPVYEQVIAVTMVAVNIAFMVWCWVCIIVLAKVDVSAGRWIGTVLRWPIRRLAVCLHWDLGPTWVQPTQNRDGTMVVSTVHSEAGPEPVLNGTESLSRAA